MGLDWRWLSFQVGIPLAAPALLSLAFVGAWQTLDGRFTPDWKVVVDLSPWAIAVYSLTLIGATFDRSWARLDRGSLSLLWLSAAANAIYYAMLVIRRHDPLFVVRAEAYYVTALLMVASIFLCYRAR